MGLRSTIRYLATGASQTGDKTDANGALDAAGTPTAPISLDVETPTNFPWIEGLEDPSADTGLVTTSNPSIMQPDEGANPIVGAYEGAFRTRGPASAGLGQEVSGGPFGDQALGRRMTFKLPLVQSASDNPTEGRVTDAAWADELASAVATNGQGEVTDAEVTQSLLLWEG